MKINCKKTSNIDSLSSCPLQCNIYGVLRRFFVSCRVCYTKPNPRHNTPYPLLTYAKNNHITYSNPVQTTPHHTAPTPNPHHNTQNPRHTHAIALFTHGKTPQPLTLAKPTPQHSEPTANKCQNTSNSGQNHAKIRHNTVYPSQTHATAKQTYAKQWIHFLCHVLLVVK